MATVPQSLERAPVAQAAPVIPAASATDGQRFVIPGIDWATYEAFGELLKDRNIRMTYDGETLELMTISSMHERFKKWIARFLEALSEELNVEIASFGSMTCKRGEIQKGVESDECYWIQHEPEVHCKDTIDLDVDPPPDLIVETEISHSLLDRLAILAALRVPEVWRFDGQALRILRLGTGGTYEEARQSAAFPLLPVHELVRFFHQRQTMGENELVRAFRQWVRAQIAAGWPAAPKPSAPGKTKRAGRKC